MANGNVIPAVLAIIGAGIASNLSSDASERLKLEFKAGEKRRKRLSGGLEQAAEEGNLPAALALSESAAAAGIDDRFIQANILEAQRKENDRIAADVIGQVARTRANLPPGRVPQVAALEGPSAGEVIEPRPSLGLDLAQVFAPQDPARLASVEGVQSGAASPTEPSFGIQRNVRVGPEGTSVTIKERGPQTDVAKARQDLQALERAGLGKGEAAKALRGKIKRIGAGTAQSEVGKLFSDLERARNLHGEGSRQAQAIEEAIRLQNVPTTSEQAALAQRFSRQASDFITVRNSFDRILTLSQEVSAINDVGLVFAIMKMFDPTSVVREGEQATLRNAAGVPDRLRVLYNGLLEGESLSQKTRGEILRTAEDLYKTALKRQVQLEGEFENLGRSLKIPNPSDLLPDFLGPDRAFLEGRAPTQEERDQAILQSDGNMLQFREILLQQGINPDLPVREGRQEGSVTEQRIQQPRVEEREQPQVQEEERPRVRERRQPEVRETRPPETRQVAPPQAVEQQEARVEERPSLSPLRKTQEPLTFDRFRERVVEAVRSGDGTADEITTELQTFIQLLPTFELGSDEMLQARDQFVNRLIDPLQRLFPNEPGTEIRTLADVIAFVLIQDESFSRQGAVQ